MQRRRNNLAGRVEEEEQHQQEKEATMGGGKAGRGKGRSNALGFASWDRRKDRRKEGRTARGLHAEFVEAWEVRVEAGAHNLRAEHVHLQQHR